MAKRRGQEILLTADPSSAIPMFDQVYRQLARAIENGELPEGARLPSIRRICEELGISHTTAERAYLQLSAEGYVRSVPRSGYVVQHIDTDYFKEHCRDRVSIDTKKDEAPLNPLRSQVLEGRKARYDFSFVNMRPGFFPSKAWHRLTDDLLFASDPSGLGSLPAEDGPGELAKELILYLHRARGVNGTASQLIVKPGTEAALTALLTLFDPARCTIGCEEPGYGSIREVARRWGFKVVPIPTDQGPERFLEAVRRSSPNIVFTTPSHQFPTGAVLPVESRIELLKWAEANGSFIIEDDACNEHRYDTRPIPSLQSFDHHGRVIYMGNFSKVLSPGLRIAYLVLPFRLLRRYWRQFGQALDDVPWMTQQILARFIRDGHWEQHVRRTMAENRRCHDRLLSELRRTMGDALEIEGVNSGIHFYVTVRNGMNQDKLRRAALAQGANVYGTERYWFSREAPHSTLMIGFSSIIEDDIAPGVEALQKAWFHTVS